MPLVLPLLSLLHSASSVVRVEIAFDSGLTEISPGLYGRNHGFPDEPGDTATDSVVALYRDAGVRLVRLSEGNNSTKYNWRRKLSSHPDWFNNVYAHDWDRSAAELQAALPGVQGLFAFQLLGKVASTTGANWDDWNWGLAHDGNYPSAAFDLAGGGSVSSDGSVLLGRGDASLYLEDWPADSTVAILDHWFGPDGIGLDSAGLRYWNMDNEPDIWGSTHDDVVRDTMAFETFLERYITVAEAARLKDPRIRLVGPVFTNDWQWWTWHDTLLQAEGRSWSPMEYFVKRVADREAETGLRLLDVFDLHFYPDFASASPKVDLLQLHRMFWDTAYAWPGSNGIHRHDGKWGVPVPNYVFRRVQRWMEAYLGEGRGRVGMTEFGDGGMAGDKGAMCADVNVCAVAYASLLGSFADHGVEVFAPWDWYAGWSEVLHLFTSASRGWRVASRSDLDSLVSAYASRDGEGDSLSVILVNRDTSRTLPAEVALEGFSPSGGAASGFSGLGGETFRSATDNAMVEVAVAVTDSGFTVDLPPLSVTAVRLRGEGATVRTASRSSPARLHRQGSSVSGEPDRPLELLALDGRVLRRGRGSVALGGLPAGLLVARQDGALLRVLLP